MVSGSELKVRLHMVGLAGFCMDTTRLFKGRIVHTASQPAEGRTPRSAEEITL